MLFLQELKRKSPSSYIWEIEAAEGLPEELDAKIKISYGNKDQDFQSEPFRASFKFQNIQVNSKMKFKGKLF